MNTENVTVIIPTFNSAVTIGRALDSIVAQSLQPTHVIVVDNASTDETLAIIRDAELRCRFRVDLIQLATNVGPGRARNIGWGYARTPLVAFLDSDDSWHPKKLERQIEVVRSHPNHHFFAHRTCHTSDANNLSLDSGQVRYYSLRHFLVRNRVSTPTVMLRTEMEFRFPEDSWYAEDFGLWTQILAAGHRAVVQNLRLTILHKAAWGESGLSAKLDDMHDGELRVLDNLRARHSIGRIEYEAFRAWMKLKYLRRTWIARTHD